MASIADNFEINVAKKQNPKDEYGTHFCRIEIPDSAVSKAEEKLQILRKLFGNDYHVSMTHWTCRGTHKEGWD